MKVRGYIHPEAAFATISEWKQIAKQFLALQKKGVDTRGGIIDSNPELAKLLIQHFGFLLYVETQRYDLLTQKNVLDFIEDFVNHRVWGMWKEFETYFFDKKKNTNYIGDIRVAYFYSRGDIEPFVLLDDNIVAKLYGNLDKKVKTMHWTTEQGLIDLQDSINNQHTYSISTFTKQWKPFFRKDSNVLLKLEGNLRGAFKSDVKSIATDHGNRAINMFRLAYPGEVSNMCLNGEDYSGGATSLWNELIVKPTKLIAFKKMQKY